MAVAPRAGTISQNLSSFSSCLPQSRLLHIAPRSIPSVKYTFDHLLDHLRRRDTRQVFLWPANAAPTGTLSLTSAQLSMLIDGVDWRAPEQQWRPAMAG
jgi:hypothetical protein